MTPGQKIAMEAFDVFDLWRKEHDPEGKLDILDAAMAYYEWTETHSITPYLIKLGIHQ